MGHPWLFLKFIEPIIDMLRVIDIDSPILNLIYDKWDIMIVKEKEMIFEYEKKYMFIDSSSFFNIFHNILVNR